MTGMTDFIAQNYLNYVAGLTAMPALPATEWLALFTAVGSDAGTGFTEVASGVNYGRVQIAGSSLMTALTASGSPTLNLTPVPAWIQPGMSVTNTTTPGSIAANTTVLSTATNTITMSNNATAGIASGNSLRFAAFTPASGSSPSLIQNGSIISYLQATGAGFGTTIAFGIYDASGIGAGNLLNWDFLGNFPWVPFFSAAGPSASGASFSVANNGYTNGDPIICNAEYGGTLPTVTQGSLVNYTINFVWNQATNSFNLNSTSGTPGSGTAVWTSNTGGGELRKITQQLIPAGVTASFAAGTLVLTAA